MISEPLIKAAISRVSAKEKKLVELRDGKVRGAGRLMLRVRSSAIGATAEFFALYHRDGRRALAKVGAYDAEGRNGGMTLAMARDRFRKEFAPAIFSGAEPASASARRQAQDKPGTVSELFGAYVEHLRIAGKRSAGKVERILLTGKSYNAAKALGGDKPAVGVEPGDISAFLATIYERDAKVMAVEARCYLHAAFNYGLRAEHDYRRRTAPGASWHLKSNPVSAVPADAEASKPGERFLIPREIKTLWDWLVEYEPNSSLAPGLRLLICTGQRCEEIMRISTASYEKPQQIVYWATTKNGRPHSVPLIQRAVAILDGMVPNKHGWYFPNRQKPDQPSPGGGLGDVVERFLDEHPEIPWFTPRDLRRTWKTCAADAGLSREMRDLLQNHARSDVGSKHYDRYSYLPERRAAMGRWEAWLDRVLAGEITEIGQRDAVVVPFGAPSAG
jgi:integrase